MGRFALLALLAVIALGLGSAASGASAGRRASAARLHVCHSKVDFNIEISSSRNMRCHTAAQDMRRYKGSIKRRFTTPGKFRCHRVSGGRLGGQWRCVRRTRAYRFEFGD